MCEALTQTTVYHKQNALCAIKSTGFIFPITMPESLSNSPLWAVGGSQKEQNCHFWNDFYSQVFSLFRGARHHLKIQVTELTETSLVLPHGTWTCLLPVVTAFSRGRKDVRWEPRWLTLPTRANVNQIPPRSFQTTIPGWRQRAHDKSDRARAQYKGVSPCFDKPPKNIIALHLVEHSNQYNPVTPILCHLTEQEHRGLKARLAVKLPVNL